MMINEQLTIVKSAKPNSNFMDGREYSPYLHLYAAMSKPEIAYLVKSFCINEELVNLGKTFEDWQNAVNLLRQIESQEKGTADNPMLFDIGSNAKLESIKNEPLFQNSFSQTPIAFKMVDIDTLVAPQRNVSLDYVEEIIKKLPDKPTLDDLIDLCISPKQSVPFPKPTQKAQNSWIFSSPSVDFRFLGGFIKETITEDDLKYTSVGGLPTTAITLFFGYGSGSINVLHANNRLVLNNGFHRVYALRKKGIKKIPVVIQTIGNPELEFPPQILNLTRDYLLKHPRPILVKDFFVDKLTRIFKKKKTIRTVRIDWGADISDIDV